MEEKVKREQENGEKTLDSPIRRARAYACAIGNSPSPNRKDATKKDNEAFGLSMSPTKKCGLE